ncbi:gliding motility-associated C-terminal domain-containing protein [Bacteroidota bacterium]
MDGRLNFHSTFILTILIYMVSYAIVNAEGTKEIMPADTCWGRLEIYPTFSDFAIYGAAPDDRLHISIASPGEKIMLGFGVTRDNQQNIMNDVEFRIRDPQGNIVYGPTTLPTSGNGFINTYYQAATGPNTIGAGGYSPIIITAQSAGDYYIEFYYSMNTVDRREFDFFDITVTDANNNPKKGRLWSKAWQFTVSGSFASSIDMYQNEFYGKVYMYADDGVVTAIDFNGMQPYVFTLSANETGCFNTGNFLNDRKSVAGRHNYPQYKIFLNDPDSLIYPTGTLGHITGPITIGGCFSDQIYITVPVNMPGNAELLLNINGIPGYQGGSEDRILHSFLIAGNNVIVWDGLDGLGNPVNYGATFELIVNYYNGLTNLPLYDVEYSDLGFKVDLIRPVGPKPTVFWDDLNLPAGTLELNGCSNPLGCHTWTFNAFGSNNTGDQNTINTWWYATSITDTIQYVHKFVHADANRLNPPNLNNDTAFCLTDFIELHGEVTFATGGFWSGGTGIFNPVNTNLDAIYYFSQSELDNGGLTLYLTTTGTDSCPAVTDSINITLHPLPLPEIGQSITICDGDIAQLNVVAHLGTSPYTFIWSTGSNDTSIIVVPGATTPYYVTVTDANGCTGTDQITVKVNPVPQVSIRSPGYCITPEKPLIMHADTSGGCISLTWNETITDPKYYVTEPGFYKVVVYNKFGCTASDSVTIHNCTEIWVPNAFTPNGDGENDFFYAQGIEILNFTMYIYNRWGELVFFTDHVNQKWDGTFNGKLCSGGIYNYIIKYSGRVNHFASSNGRIAGHVMLIR